MNCNGISFFPSNITFHASHEDERRTPYSLYPDFHGKRSASGNEGEDDPSDEGSQAGEKKRRLGIDQVTALEKNFELGNKLEPERKMELARALGLKPRQIAIWFQNRRARWKTKKLEKDYDILAREYESVKVDNEQLRTHNQRLRTEIAALKSRDSSELINLNIETDQGSCSNRSENSAEIKVDITMAPASDYPPPSKSHFPVWHSGGVASRQGRSQFHKPDQMVKEDSLANMFSLVDDHSGFWPWLEHHHFN